MASSMMAENKGAEERRPPTPASPDFEASEPFDRLRVRSTQRLRFGEEEGPPLPPHSCGIGGRKKESGLPGGGYVLTLEYMVCERFYAQGRWLERRDSIKLDVLTANILVKYGVLDPYEGRARHYAAVSKYMGLNGMDYLNPAPPAPPSLRDRGDREEAPPGPPISLSSTGSGDGSVDGRGKPPLAPPFSLRENRGEKDIRREALERACNKYRPRLRLILLFSQKQNAEEEEDVIRERSGEDAGIPGIDIERELHYHPGYGGL